MALIPKMRFRFVYMAIFTILFLVAAFLGDPDSHFIQHIPMGAGFVASMLVTLRVVLFVTIIHISRKAWFDYIDLSTFFNKAKENPIASAIVIFSMVLVMWLVGFLIWVAVR